MTEAPPTPLSILLVEDDPVDALLFERAVQQTSPAPKLLTSSTGEEALRILGHAAAEDLPDVIVLDLRMPGMSGLDVLEAIRGEGRFGATPVFIYSGAAQENDLVRAHRAGVTAFFEKGSASPQEVVSLICSLARLGVRPTAELTAPRTAEAAETSSPAQIILESVPLAIVGVDRSANIREWNPAAEKLFSLTREEALGRRARILVPEERWGELLSGIEGAVKGSDSARIEIKRVDASGAQRHISLKIAAVPPEASPDTVRATILGADVTETHEAQELFRLAVEASPAATIMVDGEGGIVLMNSEAERVFGYSREELLGKPVENLVPERFRGNHPGRRHDYLSMPEKRAMGAGRELYGLRRDGTEFPIEIGLNPIETQQGVRVLSSILDITARRQAEQRFRLVVESAPNGVVVSDSEGRIMLVNRQTEILFGYSREELLGSSVDLLVPERSRHQHVVHRSGFLQSPSNRPMGQGRDLYARRKDGTEVPIEIGLKPIETPEGTLVLASIVDIGPRKANERALALHRQELERSNRELEHFGYVVSHDLRAPLRAVSSLIEILQTEYSEVLDDQGRSWIEMVVASIGRMDQLIQGLLEYARVGRSAKARSVPLQESVHAALSNLGAEISELEPVIELPGEFPTVMGTPTELIRLFQNLIENSLKYRRTTPPKIRLSIRAEDPETLLVAIEDNGIGIAPEHHRRVFDVFQRIDTGLETTGTGVGLSVARRIVESLGGSIWIESEVGKGTTIFFTLRCPPNGQVDSQRAPDPRDEVESDPSRRNEAPGRGPEGEGSSS